MLMVKPLRRVSQDRMILAHKCRRLIRLEDTNPMSTQCDLRILYMIGYMKAVEKRGSSSGFHHAMP